MKTFSTVIASMILASGSAVAVAATDQQGAATDRPGATMQQREDRTGAGQGGATGQPGAGVGQQQDGMEQRTGVGQQREGMERLPAFSTLDRDGTGQITREEASAVGIDEDKFDEMDQDGDGVVSQEEFQQFRQDQHDEEDY